VDIQAAKFPKQMLAISIPEAVAYFDDVENGEDPISLKGKPWEQVKNFIRQKISEYLR
jgi:hypothetical protein